MTIRNFYLTVALLLIIDLTANAQVDSAKIKQVETNLVGSLQVTGEAPYTLQERMAFYKVHGLSIAVIQNYHMVWAKGYGYADDSLKISVTPRTLFQAASISKSLNAVGVLKLAQDHKLDIFADINNYLRTWKFPYDSLSKGKKISTANLLSHTGGLTVHGFDGYEPGAALPSVVQILDGKKPANSPAVRSMYEPGIKSEYSGGGTVISQLIVMDITHEPYAAYMKKNVLRPLGMISSTFAQPPVNINRSLLATAYDEKGKKVTGKYHIYPEEAPAGLWTNPTDLSKYIIETQLAYEGKSAKVLDQKSTRLRLTPYLNKSAALGVFIDEREGTKYFSHSGSNAGFISLYNGSFEGGNGFVIMANSDNSGILTELVNSIAKVYGFKGMLFTTVKTIVNVSDPVKESYVGKYQVDADHAITLSWENKQLYGQLNAQPKFALFAEADNQFFARTLPFPFDITFKKDASGNVNAATLNLHGQIIEAKKVK
jgi:CubicO group peptidase (beta-lactamase class C family)